MLSQSLSHLLLRFSSWTTYVYLEFSLLRVYKLVYIVVVCTPIYPSSLEPVKVATILEVYAISKFPEHLHAYASACNPYNAANPVT